MKALRSPQENLQQKLAFAAMLLIFVLVLSGQSLAQLSTASVNGVVRDSSGALVPNAQIVLRNTQTSVENTTVSNSAGAYSIFNITPGQYTIKATATGFGPKEVPAFTLTVSQIATINFSLSVGTQSSVVTVQSAEPQLQVASANLGTVISTEEVNDLPLNGRNFTQLLTLSPGISPISTGQNANLQAGGGWEAAAPIGSDTVFPSVNGQSNRSDFFLTDGMNNFGEFISSYAVPPILDALQEFKVVSHTDSAEFGGVLGGVINVTTKSGTNTFHGSAWEYARNALFDARTYFLPTNVPKASYSQNQFGGAIGGPVLLPHYNGRNKTFFFGAYQGFRYLQTSNTPLHVPTAQELSGDLSDWPTQIYNPFSTRPDPAHPGQYISTPFPGNQIPASLIQKDLVDYAQFAYPSAGAPFDSSGDNALDTTPITQVQNEWDIRVDQKIGANDSAFFRYSALNSTVTESAGLPGDPEAAPTPSRNWGGSYVHVFNPSTVLQGQVAHAMMRQTTSYFFTKSTSSLAPALTLIPSIGSAWVASPNRPAFLALSISGYSTNPGEYVDGNVPTDNWEYSGSLEKTLGTHTLHFGGGYTSMRYSSSNAFPDEGFTAQNTADPNPLDTVNQGSALASYLLGIPNSYYVVNAFVVTRPGGNADAYAQDSWKVSPKLTFNYGLRYDLTFIPPFGRNYLTPSHGGPYIGDYDFSNGTYVLQKLPPACNVTHAAPCIPGDGTLPDHVVVSPNGKLFHNVYTNFGPRIGFADQIGDKSVIRGAFGIVYDNWAALTQVGQNVVGTWPDVGYFGGGNLNLPSSVSPTPTITATNPLAAGGTLPAPTPFTQNLDFADPHRGNPMSEQWNFGGERQLNRDTVVTLNYVGMVSHRLDVGGSYNTALTPGPGDPQSRSLYPYAGVTGYDRPTGSANYNAVQFSIVKRYTNNWSYSVAYTWSKTINTGTDGWFASEGGGPQDPYDPAGHGSRAIAGFSVPNMLAVDLLYEVPVGRGKRFSMGNGALDYILGNWQINNIFIAHSGSPSTPLISSDIANIGCACEYLNLVGNPHLSKRTPAEWFNTAAYAVPLGYTYGDAGRNSIVSAGYWDLDSSLFRLIPIRGEREFEFRLEAFNLMNNVVLGSPITDYNSGPEFGTINSTANTSRELQLGLKFIF